LQLLANLAKIGVPIVVIAMAALWILGRDAKQMGALRVTANLRGADIQIDGVQTGALTDTFLTDVTVGRRFVTLRMPGYVTDPEVAIVEIQSDRTALASFMLKDSTTVVRKDVVPSPRDVRQTIFDLDERAVRSIPPAPSRSGLIDYAEADIEEYDNSQSKPDRPSIGEMNTQDGNSDQLDAPSARAPLTGTEISVTSSPDGAAIWVNGAVTELKTPYTFHGLDRGLYVFSLEYPNHKSNPDSIQVLLRYSQQHELVSFALEPQIKLPDPQLSVQTKPLAAGIKIDGANVGVGSARVTSSYGTHVVEFAPVPGYSTPAPQQVSLTPDAHERSIEGTYVRLSGNSLLAVVPNDGFIGFDGSLLRIYVDNELILDGPKDRFDATLLGGIAQGERLIRIEYADMTSEEFVQLADNQVAEVTMRVEAFFSKRKLKLKARSDIPLDKWQARYKKSNVLTQS
jgi:hypothetical protein